MQHLYLMLWCCLVELQNHSGWRNLRRFVVQLSAQSKDLKWTQTRLPRILSLGNLQKLNLCNLCERLFLRLNHSQWELPFLLSEDLSCVSVCFILFYHASLISPALSSQWSLCQAAMSLPKLPPWGWTSPALSASHWPSAPVPSHLSGPLLNLFHVISVFPYSRPPDWIPGLSDGLSLIIQHLFTVVGLQIECTYVEYCPLSQTVQLSLLYYCLKLIWTWNFCKSTTCIHRRGNVCAWYCISLDKTESACCF